MTQALRHPLQEQLQTPCSRTEYTGRVQQVYKHYPDSDAMLKAAWMVEPLHDSNGILL